MRKRSKTTRTTNAQALAALTQLAGAAWRVAGWSSAEAEAIENAIDVLAPAVRHTVDDVYAPLWRCG
jgi:hypothetical protein